MSDNIQELTAEHHALVAMLDTHAWDKERSDRLYEVNRLLNKHHNYSKLYYRGGYEYPETSKYKIGEQVEEALKVGCHKRFFMPTHVMLGVDNIMRLSPCTPYDYNNEEHQQMMREKYAMRLSVDSSRIEYGDERININAHLSFSYYLDGNMREANLDIYIHDGYSWEESGVNWSAMGTKDTTLTAIYAEMMLIACQIHDSLFSVAMKIKHTKPEPLDIPPQV
jgi:hypothetical protein